MTDHPGRFDPAELRPADGPAPSDVDLAAALGTARSLEALTARTSVTPTEGFEDRVMAAIATEAVPKVVVRPAAAVRGGRPVALLVAIRDAWGVAFAGGRPVMVRAQGMAFVLLVMAATISVTAFAAVGAASLFSSPSNPPSFSPPPAPTSEPSIVAPSTPPSAAPVASDESPSTEPGETESDESAEPAGSDDKASDEPSETSKTTRTPKPSATAHPTNTPDETEEPDETDEPEDSETPEPDESEDHGGSEEDHSGPG